MNQAIIGLGSNIDPQKNIANARKILSEQFALISESAFIQTKPVGYADQDDFINGAVLLTTKLDENGLKQKLKAIEKHLGRTASQIKSGPRSIDLDILVFNGKIVDPDVYTRDFLQNSIRELLPAFTIKNSGD